MADENVVIQQINNGWCKFSIGTQVLQWNTGVANIFTSDPYGLEGEALTAVTVQAGDTVGDGYDTTYWTYGEGPVECVITNAEDAVIYNGTPWFKAEGGLVTVHPTADQIESGRVGSGIDHSDYVTSTSLGLELSGYLEVPVAADEITGVRGTADTAILAALLTALDGLGLITDSTTAE